MHFKKWIYSLAVILLFSLPCLAKKTLIKNTIDVIAANVIPYLGFPQTDKMFINKGLRALIYKLGA
jgi:hypothetical protein